METDRLASAYVQALCAYLPCQINMETSYEATAKSMLSLMEQINDLQQAIQDEVQPCKEEVRLQELSGTITSPHVIPDEARETMQGLIDTYGLEVLHLIPPLQPAPQATENLSTLTDGEREYMKRLATKHNIKIAWDDMGVYYLNHSSCGDVQTDEVGAYKIVCDIAAHEYVQATKEGQTIG